MPSLARSVPKPLKVPSLARSVRAGVGAGAGAKEEEKKAISTQAVCIPPGSPSEARLVFIYFNSFHRKIQCVFAFQSQKSMRFTF